MQIPDFTRAFRDSVVATAPDGKRATMRVQSAGELVMTTGHIVACDPFCLSAYDTTESFTVTVAPGRYSVMLSLAHFQNTDDLMYRWSRVAYAMLRFGEIEPVLWQPAHVEPNADGTIVPWDGGYGVDAGTGCFADIEAARALKSWLEADANNHDELVRLFVSSLQSDRPWMRFTPNPALNANIIMFSSGWGDGLYFSYVGYNAGGEAVCLVTDFHVFEEGTTFE